MKREDIEKIKSKCNDLKSKLISIMYELEEVGANREAKQLGNIIGRLEEWQHK